MSDLPPGWAEASLNLLGRWCGGGTPSKRVPGFWLNGTLPWVSPKDMKSEVIHDSEDHITEAALRGSTTNLVEPGSVLIVTRSGILQHTLPVATTTRPLTINQDLKALTPHQGLVTEYLAWALRANAQRILRDCSKEGTTVQSIETTQLLRFVLSIAPTAEQERIVAAIEEQFFRLDAGIAALDAASAKAGTLSNAAMEAAVRSWDQVPLRELLLSLRNGIFVSRPGTAPTRRAVLRISAVRPLKLDAADVRFVPESTTLRNEDAFRIEAGNLLFTRYNGNADLVGRCAVVGAEAAGLLYPDKLIRAVVNRSRAMPDYLEIALNCGPSLRAIAQLRKTTAGQVGIAGAQLLDVPVPLPSLEDQERIVARTRIVLDASRELRLEMARARRRCAGLRSATLAAAFSGKLVPHDPNDEPASVLLERIARRRMSSNGHNTTRARKQRTTGRKVLA